MLVVGTNEYTYLSPYIIAEIGVNHECDLSRAKKMIEQVASSGGHAAKFQTYKADKISAKNSPAYWSLNSESTGTQHELFKKYDLFNDDDYIELSEHCSKCGIDFLSTPFDLEAVDTLAPLVPAFKIASADITNIPLLRKVAATRKLVILSTGASTRDEINSAVTELKSSGAKEIVLLHCVLNYPTPKKYAQMFLMTSLKDWFPDLIIGYSDHVPPEINGQMPSVEMACINGAMVVEKHFTDDKSLPGNDHYHSMDASDLRQLQEKLDTYRILYGSAQKRDINVERLAIENARRRIYAARDLKRDCLIKESDLIPLRSNLGIEISQWDKVIGKKINKEVLSGMPIEWEYLF